MKKLLIMFGAIGLVATSSASVVACGSKAGDSGTSGPSKDDVAKWDAMEIGEFEEHLFGKTIINMIEYSADLDDVFENILPEEGETVEWKDSYNTLFVTWFNEHFDIKAFNLIKYGKDRFKREDPAYINKLWDWDSDLDWDLITPDGYVSGFLSKDSNVKSLTTNISFTKWRDMLEAGKPQS